MTRVGVLALLLLWLPGAAGAVFQGVATSQDGFAFAAKFCFDYGSDRDHVPHMAVRGTLSPPAGYLRADKLRVLLYDDEPESWRAVYKNESARCAERGMWPTQHGTDYALLPTGTTPPEYTFEKTIYEHLRPRTWFVVVVDTECEPLENVEYRFEMLNGDDFWDKEFGVNERGLNSFFLLCVLGYTFLGSYQWNTDQYHQPERTANMARLLTCSVAVSALSMLFYSVHYLRYTLDGRGSRLFEVFAEVADTSAELLLVLLVLLGAQGWCLFLDEIKDWVLTLKWLGALSLAKVGLRLWGSLQRRSASQEGAFSVARDAASTYTIWDSVPGLVLIGLDLAIFLLFARLAINTRRKQLRQLGLARPGMGADDAALKASLRTFHLISATGAAWLLLRPVGILIFANILTPWVREKYLTALTTGCTILAQIALSRTLAPSDAALRGGGSAAASALVMDYGGSSAGDVETSPMISMKMGR